MGYTTSRARYWSAWINAWNGLMSTVSVTAGAFIAVYGVYRILKAIRR